MLAFDAGSHTLGSMAELLLKDEIGARVTEVVGAAQTDGATPGELAVIGAKVLLEHLFEYEEDDTVGIMFAKLKGAGLDEVRADIASSLGHNERAQARLDYRIVDRPRWDVAAPIDDMYGFGDDLDEDPVSHRDAIAQDYHSGFGEEVGQLYRTHFEATLALFAADAPELDDHMEALVFPEHDLIDWSKSFPRDLIKVFTEEEQYDAALRVSRYLPSIKDVEQQLLTIARAGHVPTILEVHRRFVDEGIYARNSYYGEFEGELQYSWEFFEAARDAGMLDVAADVVNQITNVSQLISVLSRAVPKLAELNHIDIPDPLTPDDLHTLTDQILTGIINDFDMTNTDKTYDIHKLHGNWEAEWKEHNRDRVESSVLFSLGIRLSYDGRVEDAERLAATLREAKQGVGTELKRFVALGHFIASDIDDALTYYRSFEEDWYQRNDTWVTRNAVVELAKRGAVAESLLMATRFYASEGFGKHAGYLLALSVAANHGVFEK